LLSSFCENLDNFPEHCHVKYDIIYTFCFGTTKYSTVDHVMLSGAFYETCIDSVTVVHNIDNMSDHQPIFMHVSLDSKHIGVVNKAHSPRSSWVQANVKYLDQYHDVLSENPAGVTPPIEALTCRDMQHIATSSICSQVTTS